MSLHPNYAVRTLRERLEYLKFRTKPNLPEVPKRIEQVEAAIKLLTADDK